MEVNLELLAHSDRRVGAYVEYSVSCNKEFVDKNKKYGQTWLCYRPKSMLTRIWNKGLRIRSIQEKKEQLIGDTILDEFKAIYNYSILTLVIVERLVNDKLAALSKININGKDDIEPLYKKAQDDCFLLFKQKDHDYDGAWVHMNISTIIDEILVKLMRAHMTIEQSYDTPVENFRKSLLEIFMDIANYAAFAGILIEECEVDPMH